MKNSPICEFAFFLCERVLSAVSEKEWNFDHEQANIAIELMVKKNRSVWQVSEPYSRTVIIK